MLTSISNSNNISFWNFIQFKLDVSVFYERTPRIPIILTTYNQLDISYYNTDEFNFLTHHQPFGGD